MSKRSGRFFQIFVAFSEYLNFSCSMHCTKVPCSKTLSYDNLVPFIITKSKFRSCSINLEKNIYEAKITNGHWKKLCQKAPLCICSTSKAGCNSKCAIFHGSSSIDEKMSAYRVNNLQIFLTTLKFKNRHDFLIK